VTVSADPFAGALWRTPFAGLRVRLLAASLDLAVVLLVGIVVEAGAGISTVSWASAGLLTGLTALYLAGSWGTVGASPGQRVLGLRVVRANDGEPISPAIAVLRVLGCVLALAPLLVGLAWVAWDSRKQGWHDKVAGTVVIHDR
jgi:uncharacterized RDD family membrane protein YckC